MIPATGSIQAYFHCRKCLDERPDNMSPIEFSKISVGFTKLGIQVWCDRHMCNIFHMDLQGHKYPANLESE